MANEVRRSRGFVQAGGEHDDPVVADEVHPLDKDYSSPQDPVRQTKTGPWTLRWVGIIGFVSGCVSLLPAAALATSFPATWLESLGSTIHRLGMICILIGGILFILARRLEQLEQASSPAARPYAKSRDRH
jgi:hypothetical protein